jgi:hypothetical protein
MKPNVLDKTQFRNVDLDIFSKSDLEPLVAAFGEKVLDLYVGRERRLYKVVLELNSERHKSPQSKIVGFCKLIRELPPAARELWDTARTRTFDIGIEATGPYKYYRFDLATSTIEAVLEINARIAVTVCGPLKEARKSRAKRAASALKQA